LSRTIRSRDTSAHEPPLERGAPYPAETPAELPKQSWAEIAKGVKAEAKDDHVTLMSAGVAFYALLALVPALIALLSVYGLLADPQQIERQVVDALKAAPTEVRNMMSQQMQDISDAGSGALLAVFGGILVALWSASSGVSNLISALNVAYNVEEGRGWVKRKLVALAFTLGAILFFVVAFGALAILPRLLSNTGLGTPGRWAANIAAWAFLLAGLAVGLAILYRYGPNRREPKWSWVSPGAILALVLWLIGSLAFSIYTANFGRYNETYGSLGAVVVVMLWLFITSLAILLGAELNAQAERRTTRSQSAPARES
jgi:membrane protein